MANSLITHVNSSIKKLRLDCTLGLGTEIGPYCILTVRFARVEEILPISGFLATLIDLRGRWSMR